jgi:hypothetical protein
LPNHHVQISTFDEVTNLESINQTAELQLQETPEVDVDITSFESAKNKKAQGAGTGGTE